MALDIAAGVFAAPVAVGPFSVVGTGFMPKALILAAPNVIPFGPIPTKYDSFGMAASPTERAAVCGHCLGGVFVSNTSSGHSETDVLLSRTNAIVNKQADFTSFDANGFTLTFSVADGNPWHGYSYLALGGADLTNVTVQRLSTPIVPGPVSYVGFGFRPTGCMLFSINTFLSTFVPSVAGYQVGLGMSDGTTQRSLANASRNGALGAACRRIMRTTDTINVLSAGGLVDVLRASMTSFDADGLTLTYSVTPAVFPRSVYCLAWSGPQFTVGAGTAPVAPGIKAFTGAGFSPLGFFQFNNGTSLIDAPIIDAISDFGITDGVAEADSYGSDDDGASPTVNYRALSVARTFVRRDAATGLTVQDAAFSSLDADGCSLSFLTSDGIARRIAFGYFGNAPSIGNALPWVAGL